MEGTGAGALRARLTGNSPTVLLIIQIARAIIPSCVSRLHSSPKLVGKDARGAGCNGACHTDG